MNPLIPINNIFPEPEPRPSLFHFCEGEKRPAHMSAFLSASLFWSVFFTARFFLSGREATRAHAGLPALAAAATHVQGQRQTDRFSVYTFLVCFPQTDRFFCVHFFCMFPPNRQGFLCILFWYVSPRIKFFSPALLSYFFLVGFPPPHFFFHLPSSRASIPLRTAAGHL